MEHEDLAKRFYEYYYRAVLDQYNSGPHAVPNCPNVPPSYLTGVWIVGGVRVRILDGGYYCRSITSRTQSIYASVQADHLQVMHLAEGNLTDPEYVWKVIPDKIERVKLSLLL